MNKIKQNFFIFIFLLSIGISCNKEDCACVEHPAKDCVCTEIYEPVCGCNGKTYSNACVAKCSGITDYSEGACE